MVKEIREKLRQKRPGSPRATAKSLEGRNSHLKFRAEKWFNDPEVVIVTPKKR